MSYIRYYVMQSKPGDMAQLNKALVALKAAVAVQPGLLSVNMYKDLEDAEKVHFVEHWDGKESHDKGAKALPDAVVSPMGALMGAPPVRYTLSEI